MAFSTRTGIGEAIARRFAREGAAVIINGRRSDAAERVATDIRRGGGKAIIALGDFSQDEEVARIVETCAGRECRSVRESVAQDG